MSALLAKRIALIAIVWLITSASQLSAQTASEGPVGLQWGASVADLQARGIELKEFDSKDFGKSYFASNLDKALSDQSAAVLSFGANDRLWRVAINGKQVTNDPSGSAALERYVELADVLREKYGAPKQNHDRGDRFYSQPSNFVYGVSNGNIRWFSNFETPAVFIQLGLFAPSMSAINWRLIYENKPLRAEFEKSRRSREKGAL